MTRYFSLFTFIILMNIVSAQEILFQENFNDCVLPSGWNLTVTNGQDAGVAFDIPLNPKSDSLSIDGSCMVVFDDDLLGNNMPAFKAELETPKIEAGDYQTIYLRTDVHFRAYDTSSFTVYLQEDDGNRIELRRFDQDDQTGTRFSEISPMSIDIRFVTESTSFSIVFVYDDGDMYAWWAGIDNIEVIGSGTGTTIVKEQFNDCALPEGWTTNILEGQDDWQFGEVGNSKANASTMDGTCFAYFDDDGLGADAPFSTAELISPVFDGSTFANFQANFDLIFRPYTDIENVTILVYDGEDYTVVKEFSDPVGGPHFNVYESINLDLSTYRSNTMQLVFRYDDGNNYGWWVGIDNVKIIAEGEINDICINADLLEVGNACLYSTNNNAVFDGPMGDCGSQLNGSLWYEMFAPATGIVKIENASNYNDVITVFTGSCSLLTNQICGNADEHGFNGETIYLDAEIGQTYYVRVSGTESTYGKSRGANCLSAAYVTETPLATAEDEISNAISIILGEECTSSVNKNATIGSMLPAENELMRSDVWYSFNSEESTAIDVKVISDFAENITVFDLANEEIYSQLRGGDFSVNGLITNTEYFIQVGGVFSQLEGDICLQVIAKVDDDAIADECIDAINIGMDSTVELDNNAQTFSGIQPSCEIYVGHDHWLEFSTLENTNIYLSTQSEYLQIISVYTGSCDALSEIWCIQQRNRCDGAIRIEGLQPQTIYYLQLSSAFTDNSEGFGLASITLSETMPLEDNLNLNVSVTCDEDETAQLNIDIITNVDYTIEGTTSQDILYHGDEYTVVAQYGDGCEKSVQGVVNCQSDDCDIQVIPFTEYLTCADADDGVISLDIQGGLGPYVLEWSHGPGSSTMQTALDEGIYNVKVTDARACYVYLEVEMISPNALMTSVISNDETMAEADNGTASITTTGGTFPYSIDWSNGASGNSVTDLSPGEYSVTVTDFNGCSSMKTFSIAELNCVFAISADQTEITCFGAEDASLSVSSTDITIEAIEWSTGAETLTITDLAAGEYSVTVSADNGCNKIEQYIITEPEEITITEDVVAVSCEGDLDGTIGLQSTGGTGEISYIWEDGSTGSMRNELATGNYQVTATDENGCTQEREINVSSPLALDVASSMASDLSCFDSQDGILCAFVEGGTEPYLFAWDGTTEPLSKVMNLSTGDYALTVTDVNGCTTATTLSIEAPEAISIQVEAMTIDDIGNGMIDITIEGGTAPYQVVWYLGTDNIAETEDISNLEEGIYHAVIIDANGCEITSPDYILSLTDITEVSSSAIEIFPNPTTGKCTITADINDWTQYSIKLVNLQGQVLDNKIQLTDTNKGNATCEISNVISGIYYIQIDSKEDASVSYRHAVMVLGEVE